MKLASHLFVALTGVAMVGGTAPAMAADVLPCETIQVVIHSSYGGGTDVTARMMSIRTRRYLKKDIQIVAKRGGSGAKAHQYALTRPKDGCTVLALTQTHLYTIARGKSPLTIDDVQGVARAMDDPTFITVSAKSKYKTLKDLIDASKEKPLNWGVAQIGGTEHIGLATFAKAAGIKYKVVPFGSGGKMVQALMAGGIDATLPNVSEGGDRVKDGTFRALAVMSEKRLKDYPNVPSTVELGYNAKASTTRGYWVLKGTPKAAIDQLADAMVKAMKHKVFASYLESSGLAPEDSVAGPEVWTKHIREEYQNAYNALKELGLLKK
ncbi:MAG TPA: tripartite tricarboxylate transporter substrate binding protein [Alphaproteobacteria bacterium]|nr:tripartite tricarboxylate transporter substrate binding protein [Alphaproteobacteria bacterium]